MNPVAGTVALLAGIFVWWLAARRLTTKSWQAQGTCDGRDLGPMSDPAPARMLGLWVFLAVVTSFFALFITAYYMRMSPHLTQGTVWRDWRPVAEPWILWVNTAMLVASSVAMQLASAAIRRNRFERAGASLLAGGLFAIGFLAGQWLAWRELQAAGYYAAANPANAFFYVLTGLHGLHLLGGLVVWGWTLARMSRGRATSRALGLDIELCTVYWHYLLVVWLVLFGVLLIT